jgi:predicted nucleotidyltransferase
MPQLLKLNAEVFELIGSKKFLNKNAHVTANQNHFSTENYQCYKNNKKYQNIGVNKTNHKILKRDVRINSMDFMVNCTNY